MKNKITLTDSLGATYTFGDTTLLIFVDDTGNSLLQDKKYPIFGYGGCMCLVQNYSELIYNPWKAVEKVFDPSQLPLHATDIGKKNKTTTKQYETINSFFASHEFGRFATVYSDRTLNNSPYETFYILVGRLHKRLLSIMKWLPFTEVVYLIEDTDDEEKKKLITHTFSQYPLEEDGKKIPVHHFFMPKKANEPGLIVADFIAHSAGTTQRDILSDKITSNSERPDFRNIFHIVSERYTSYMYITSIEATKKR